MKINQQVEPWLKYQPLDSGHDEAMAYLETKQSTG